MKRARYLIWKTNIYFAENRLLYNDLNDLMFDWFFEQLQKQQQVYLLRIFIFNYNKNPFLPLCNDIKPEDKNA